MKDDALLGQKALVDSFLIKGPRPLSAFSFVSLFAWCDFFEFEFKMINDCLCIFAKGPTGTFLYLPPLGAQIGPSTIKAAFEHMAQGRRPKAVNRIENIPGNLLPAFREGSYNQHTRPEEYVYLKDDLTALKGNAYKSQRHDCNCFLSRRLEHSFAAYTDADFDACRDLYERWAKGRAASCSDQIYCSMLQENGLVHSRLLKFWKPLGIVARVLRTQGDVVGYTFGFALDENTFCVYAEVADLRVTGAAAYMFRCLCADQELRFFSRINTMDDFAIPKVAQAKQAYHPSERVVSYTVSLKV